MLSGFPSGSALDVVIADHREGLFLLDCLRLGEVWLGAEKAIDRFARIAPFAPVGGGVYLPLLTMGDFGEFLEEARADPAVAYGQVKRWDSPLVGGTEASAENPHWTRIEISSTGRRGMPSSRSAPSVVPLRVWRNRPVPPQ